MSLIVKTFPTGTKDHLKSKGATLMSSTKCQEQIEEVFDFSTIDGGVVNHKAGSKAISSGSGIFIGDYFVGVSDSYLSISNLPFVRY